MSDGWVKFEDAWEGQGYTQIPNCVMRDGAISMEAKYLFGLLKSYAWEDPEAHPGLDRLTAAAGVSHVTLSKYMKELATVGLIEVRRRGQGKTNQYFFPSLKRRYGPELKTGFNQDRKGGLRKEDTDNKDSVKKRKEREKQERLRQLRAINADV